MQTDPEAIEIRKRMTETSISGDYNMAKQCPSCGGICGYTKASGCKYKAARPVDEGWKEYNALVDRILAGTDYDHIDDWLAHYRAAKPGN